MTCLTPLCSCSLSIGGNFHDDATKASLDVMEDDGKKMSMANNKMRW